MKRLSLTTILMTLSLVLGAQNFSEWTHTNTNPFCQMSQCYDIMELGDGNLVVKEAVFDNYIDDIGYNLYKITPNCELLDSLFVDDNNIYGLNPMLRDPETDNSNILISFYNDGKKHYMRTYFNDDLEITDEVATDYPEELKFPDRFFVDSNSDIICRVRVNDDDYPPYRLMKMGIDGTIKALSDTLSKVFDFTDHALFELSSDPMRYGCVTWIGNAGVMNIEIFDADLNLVKSQRYRLLGEWKSGTTTVMNVCGLSDGHFVMSIDVYKFENQQPIYAPALLKFNSELEMETMYVGKTHKADDDPFSFKNLVATGQGIYFAWLDCKNVGKQSLTNIAVTYLDNDLNYVWSSGSNLFVDNDEKIIGFGMTLMENGRLALSGWIPSTIISQYFRTKTIYAMVIDNQVWSTDEVTAVGSPFVCYPNPAKNTVNITFSDDTDCQSVEIYAIDGRLVKSQISNFETVDVSKLNAGVYILKVNMADGREFTERIVKE